MAAMMCVLVNEETKQMRIIASGTAEIVQGALFAKVEREVHVVSPKLAKICCDFILGITVETMEADSHG